MADAVAEVDAREDQEAVLQNVTSSNAKGKRFFSGKKFSARDVVQKLVGRNREKKFKRASGNAVMSYICSLGALSFRAYEDPVAAGFDEVTATGNRIRHLNYDVLNDAVEGVLKIRLERARNVLDADFFAGKSDPYAVFSTGWSQVASETKQNDDNPVWNSDHYLLVRKPGVVQRDTDHLTVSLYDSDTFRGSNQERNFRQSLIKDDFLGSATVDIADFKEPGVHQCDLALHLEGDRRPVKTTIVFSVEFITFEEACRELGKEKESRAWIHSSEEEPQSETSKWMGLTSNSELDRILFQRIAFINGVNTGTQVWIHANTDEKKVAIAFRGTESTRLKDLLTDLKFLSTRLTWDRHVACSLKLKDVARQKSIRVHSGFRTAYASVWSTILTIVEQMTNWSSDWTIHLTGHSLGGALATLCAFEYANRTSESGDGPRIVMMNFGAPRVGNKEFVRVYCMNVAESYRVINKLDIIHRLPRLMKHVPREVSLEEDGDIVIDKLQSIKHDFHHSQTDDEDRENLQMHHPERLTRKGVGKLPGFKGHFENYYFDMVAMATRSIYEGTQSHMTYILGELKDAAVNALGDSDGKRSTAKATNTASNSNTCPPEASTSSHSP